MFCEGKIEMLKDSEWDREITSIFLKFFEECAKSDMEKKKRVPPIERIRTIRNILSNAKDAGSGTWRSLRIYGCPLAFGMATRRSMRHRGSIIGG